MVNWKHFGLTDAPFKRRYNSGDERLLKRSVQAAVEERAWLAVTGPVGSGKTTGVTDVLLRTDCTVVKPLSLDRQRMRIGAVVYALIEHLSRGEERPRRTDEARSAQVCRIVGEHVVARGERLCVVLEEAHLLHHSTLVALKSLRELSYRGVWPLCSVILVGQDELAGKLARHRSVGRRVKDCRLAGLTGAEVRDWLGGELGGAADPLVIEYLARRSERAPLAIMDDVERAAELCEARGGRRVEMADVQAGEADLKAVISVLGETYGTLAIELGVSKTRVSDALNGKSNTRDDLDRIRASVNEKLAKRAG